MVAQMDAEGFGNCTLHGECQEACPKEISIDTIARMNRDYMTATISHRRRARAGRHRMTVTTSPIPSVREWTESAREERRS